MTDTSSVSVVTVICPDSFYEVTPPLYPLLRGWPWPVRRPWEEGKKSGIRKPGKKALSQNGGE